jgi:hypothetical protein
MAVHRACFAPGLAALATRAIIRTVAAKVACLVAGHRNGFFAGRYGRYILDDRALVSRTAVASQFIRNVAAIEDRYLVGVSAWASESIKRTVTSSVPVYFARVQWKSSVTKHPRENHFARIAAALLPQAAGLYYVKVRGFSEGVRIGKIKFQPGAVHNVVAHQELSRFY